LAFGITAALIAAAVLGLWFTATRGIAVAAVAALTFLFPWLAAPILIGSVGAFYLFRFRK
jgi:hypothetical protein